MKNKLKTVVTPTPPKYRSTMRAGGRNFYYISHHLVFENVTMGVPILRSMSSLY